MAKKTISGFSKLTKTDKIYWLAKNFAYSNPIEVMKEFAGFWHDNVESQKLFDGFSENTLTNFYLPFGVAPNFMINDKVYAVPMVIEESSVVAAAANAAKFWMNRGGIEAEIIDTKKIGQVHFNFDGDAEKLIEYFPVLKDKLIDAVDELTVNMRNRGGGISDLELIDFTHEIPNYFQLKGTFQTCDSMGANFINSILEAWGASIVQLIEDDTHFSRSEKAEVVMCILSNYTPECLVKTKVSCPVEDLGAFGGGQISAEQFAQKFVQAVKIAEIDPYRATTHNKGIMNGVDAVVLATGNDFRAVESCIHTYAGRSGQYRSLSSAKIEDGIFSFELSLPMALGTVGGLTSLHPLAKRSMELLNNPSAAELMKIACAVGLAQNFAAVKSLITTGIQQGHMKMHLSNILNQFEATPEESAQVEAHFLNQVISVSAVRDFLTAMRRNLKTGISRT